MSDNYNKNWGDDIRNAVVNSVNTGDISYFSETMMDKANQVLDNARAATAKYSSQGNYSRPQQTNYASYNAARPQQVNGYVVPDSGRHIQRPTVQQRPPRQVRVVKTSPNVGGLLATVVGGFSSLGTGFTTAILLIGAMIEDPIILIPAAIVGTVFAGAASLFGFGMKSLGLTERGKRYVRYANGRSYINIAELAEKSGRTPAQILKDVRKLIAKGIYPQGHLDRQNTCLMLTDSTYREYTAIENERAARAKEITAAEIRDKQLVDAKAKAEAAEHEKLVAEVKDPRLAEMIKQGNDYIRQLHQLNEQIPGEVITNKLFRMESTLTEIFERLKTHPESMAKMKRTMDYFLPTTVKLVQAYHEYDTVPDAGDEIQSAKAEIERTIDTINSSFTELLNRLFEQSVMDVTSDAKVLQTMLAQEGLAQAEDIF